jgi:hypothetical protein
MSTEDLSDEMREIIAHIARLDFNDFRSIEVQQGLGLSAEDLAILRAHPYYDTTLQSLRFEAMSAATLQKELLTKIKTRALQNINMALADDVSNADMALRAALTADKLIRSKEDNPMHRIQTPGGAITLELPVHIVGVLQAPVAERIEIQQGYLLDTSKNTGMIGAEGLKRHLGIETNLDDVKVVESTDYFDVTF